VTQMSAKISQNDAPLHGTKPGNSYLKKVYCKESQFVRPPRSLTGLSLHLLFSKCDARVHQHTK
jgi:hypothetical protein